MKVINLNLTEKTPNNFTGIIKDENGLYWYKEGKCHREDGPAIEWENGTKEWYKEGKKHREDGPALEYPGGSKEWYKNDLLHREGGPAVERADGTKEWFLEGECYLPISLKDYPILEYYDKGKYGLIWYKLLDKDKIIEYPDIPGLIAK